MNMRDPAVLMLGVIITAVMFAVVAFFTRASRKRIIGALIGGSPLIPLVRVYDAIATRLGLWHYPSVANDSVPLGWYVAAALWYGSGLGLIGWRVIRRFGSIGFVVFLIAFSILGVTRDYLYSIMTRLIIFGAGRFPLIADLFAYASAAAVVQLCMYWIVGPPKSDPLKVRGIAFL